MALVWRADNPPASENLVTPNGVLPPPSCGAADPVSPSRVRAYAASSPETIGRGLRLIMATYRFAEDRKFAPDRGAL
jgi:hypothetical protein